MRAVNEPGGRILTGEDAPTGPPETPEGELGPRWVASHREAVTMGELANRLADTLHNTAGNREGVPVMITIVERSQWLTEVHLDGGAGVLHLRAGAWR